MLVAPDIARSKLRNWQSQNLPALRLRSEVVSAYFDHVTLIAYTFPRDPKDFDYVEFSIRHSWRLLGMLKTVVIADRMTGRLAAFKESNPRFVDVQIEPSLQVGDVPSMSVDCIERLHQRFSTPYCLIVQDDGFPLRDNLGDFLGRYDFFGAPTYRPSILAPVVDCLRMFGMNGGFSLRSHKICENAAREWRRKPLEKGCLAQTEDVFYTVTACRNPFYRLKHRFPGSNLARRFSVIDFDGALDVHSLGFIPFGVHGASTALQYMEHLNELGYLRPRCVNRI